MSSRKRVKSYFSHIANFESSPFLFSIAIAFLFSSSGAYKKKKKKERKKEREREKERKVISKSGLHFSRDHLLDDFYMQITRFSRNLQLDCNFSFIIPKRQCLLFAPSFGLQLRLLRTYLLAKGFPKFIFSSWMT